MTTAFRLSPVDDVDCRDAQYCAALGLEDYEGALKALDAIADPAFRGDRRSGFWISDNLFPWIHQANAGFGLYYRRRRTVIWQLWCWRFGWIRRSKEPNRIWLRAKQDGSFAGQR